jgi:zinc protease
MSELELPVVEPRFFELPNGLELIVLEDHSAPVASVQAWVRTGSIHEGEWLGAGLSHFLEHMLFKGTPTRGPQDFARSIQEHGGYINAYTSYDRTVYWVDIPAGGVCTAVELLSDALMNSTLPAEEFAKEQEVIRREFAMGFDDPDSVAGKQLFATACVEHPIRHPVIGHLAVFDRLAHDDLAAYYRARYAPNNIFFVVAGAVDADAVLARVTACFESHARRPLPDVLIPAERPQLGRREKHSEVETELTRLGMAWHIPGITHPDVPALDLLATVLGSGRSARLYRRLREGLAIVHSVDAWAFSPMDAGLFGVDAVLDPEHSAKVESEVLAMISDVQANGVQAAELGKARRQFLSHHFQSLSTMRGRANDLGSNWLYTRNLHFTRDYLAATQAVVPEDLARVARTYLTGGNLTVSSVNPRGTLRKTSTAAAAAAPRPIEMFVLSNGLRLLVREDHRLPMVSLVSTFKAGLLAETAATNGLSRLVARTMVKGTRSRTAEELAGQIESVGGALGADSGNNSLSVTARVLQPDLALGVELIADVLLNAAFSEKAMNREKEAQLASIKADEEEITSVARNLFRARLFGDHPFALRTLGTPERVRSYRREDLVAFRDRHIAGRNGVLAVFGAVKGAEVCAVVEAAFDGLAAGTPTLDELPQPPGLDESAEVVATRPKTQAVIMIGFPGVDLFSPDRVPLELIDEACSDLGSRMFNRIREEMGLAYFVGSSNLMGLAPGAFSFYAGTDPAKAGEVKAALADEIRKLAADGITSDELERTKAKLLGAHEIRNQSNDALAFSCALDELYGLGFRHYEGLRARVEAVTHAQVREVARRYFSQAGVTAIVRP